MDYFYKPYESRRAAGIPITIRYDVESPNTKMKARNFSENSKINWKSISGQVLKSSKNEFKDLIKAVNYDFYSNIREAAKLTSNPGSTKKDYNIGLKLFKKAIANKFSMNQDNVNLKPNEETLFLSKKNATLTPLSKIASKTKNRGRRGSLLYKDKQCNKLISAPPVNTKSKFKEIFNHKKALSTKIMQIKAKRLSRKKTCLEWTEKKDKILSKNIRVKPKFDKIKDLSVSDSHNNSDSSVELSSIRIRTSSCPLRVHKRKNKSRYFRNLKQVKSTYKADKKFVDIQARINTLIH